MNTWHYSLSAAYMKILPPEQKRSSISSKNISTSSASIAILASFLVSIWLS